MLKTLMKKFFFVFSYAIYLACFLISIDYFFYFAYKNKIFKSANIKEKIPTQSIKNIEPILMSRIGFVKIGKKSSFVNFDLKKRNGFIRIGCFGDSFTYGDEVNLAGDYPSLLQDIFIKNGYNNIEVINFGNSWYGFSQAFMLWKYLGQKYDLDIVLLGPRCLDFYERVLSFNHAWRDSGRTIDYMHARYILKNGSLELLDVLGAIREEKIKNYFRFFTPLRYLRFDINTPPFLSCLIPNKRDLVRNPFYYYKGSAKKESEEIYKLFFSEMVKNGSKIILCHYSQDIVKFVNGMHKSNIYATTLYTPIHFPYIMLKKHNSIFANQLVALQMFDFITGREKSQFDILETADIEKEMAKWPSIKKRNIFDYSDIKVEIDGRVVGTFKNGYNSGFEVERESKCKVTSILAIKRKDSSILDGVFIPLDFDLLENMVLEISFRSAYRKINMSLGAIKMLNPNLQFGVIELEGIATDESKVCMNLSNIGIKALGNQALSDKRLQVEILLNGRPLLSAFSIQERVIEFKPIKGNFLIIRPTKDSFIDIDRLADSGIIYLTLVANNGELIRLPFLRWNKVRKIILFDKVKE